MLSASRSGARRLTAAVGTSARATAGTMPLATLLADIPDVLDRTFNERPWQPSIRSCPREAADTDEALAESVVSP
ncbi:MAG TPA: hypothetical protein VKV69_03085, partial [Actinomycetota bacterium]|nr:hypothetical protein [Actinomycetota bacterium]